MLIELLIVAYLIGVAVDGFLRGMAAGALVGVDVWKRGDRERAWLSSLVWPLSMWLELGVRFKRWWD